MPEDRLSRLGRADALRAADETALLELLNRNAESRETLTRSYALFSRWRARRNFADSPSEAGRLEDRFYTAVARWAHTIESKDAYTGGHCERVARYASALARDVGFDERTVFWFRIGALLHDVGKLVVPTAILNKPGRLTREEREVMQRHPTAGAQLLATFEFPEDVRSMVRAHHERWDGRGYPDGLAGEDIPLSARIVCVADVFDALTTDRPYRRAYARDEALAIMRADRDSAFESAIFDRFARLIQSPGLYQKPRVTAVSRGLRPRFRPGRGWS